LDHVLVVGDRLAAHRPVKTALPVGTAFDRQALAFGRSLNEMLAGLRVGIIGCGATGSAVGMLLARLGVGRLYVVDRDFVEESNLNRLHGATMADVKVRRLKVDVFRHHVESMGIGVSVATHVGWVGEEACRDALRSCDVIFGCTDDHDGRLLLNRLAYFYLIPVIDMGFKVDVADEDPPRILEAAGRVTVLMPGTRCLLCRNTVDVTKARDEQLARVNPEEFLIRREQQYVDGDAGPSPSVVTFTTDVACMAVDELIHRITGYRRAHAIANRVRKYHLAADKHPGPRGDDDCPLCLDTGYWGRGDMNPFLDRIG
jgi:molybdopterin/thiamine biosynthesis adenylyltransferase